MRAPCFLPPRDFRGQNTTNAPGHSTRPAPLPAGDDQRGHAHGRTLLGAVDAHLGTLAHTRPWLVAEREAELVAMARAWLDAGGPNWLPSVSWEWVGAHVAALPGGARAARAEAARDLLAWARAEGLLPGSGA